MQGQQIQAINTELLHIINEYNFKTSIIIYIQFKES